MGRRDYPNAEKIAKQARKLRDGTGAQKALNNNAVDQYTQAHVIEARKRDAKAIGFGTVGNMVDRRVNILGARPAAKVIARGGSKAEEHASDTLEPWLNTIIWQAQGDFDVWDTGIQDQQTVGCAWSKVLPAAQFYGDTEYEELVAEWLRLIEARKDTDDVRERIRLYRRDNPTIAWRYVDPTSTFMEWDERGIAGVYEFCKMTQLDIEARWPGVVEGKEEDVEVVHYANDVYVATLLPEGKGVANTGIARTPGKFLGEPWEHGMGINPYVRIKRGPLRANTQGYEYTGCAFHAREMSDTLDRAVTAWSTGMDREARSPVVFRTIPSLRVRIGKENEEIRADADGNLVLYGSKEDGNEEVFRYPTPTVNEQLGALISMVGAQADRSGAWVPQLQGYGPSGESAVHQDLARQSAITGEMEMPHRHLEEGFAEVCKRFFRCVVALDEQLPEGADNEMRKVVVRHQVGEHGSKEIAVTAKDVREYDPLVRGVIALNLPVNMSQNTTNAKLLTDPEHPLVDDNTAREVLLNFENPQEIGNKIHEQNIVNDIVQVYRDQLKQRAMVVSDELSDEDMAKIAEELQNMSPEAAQALVAEISEGQGGMMGDVARGAANTARTARGQRQSRLQGMGVGPMEQAR
jgi:hypothetical protein